MTSQEERSQMLQSKAFGLYHRMVAICVPCPPDACELLDDRWSLSCNVLDAIEDGRVYLPWRKDDIKTKGLIEDSLEALGIDSEQFWWAVKFLQHFSNDKFIVGAYRIRKSLLEETLDAVKSIRASWSNNPYISTLADMVESSVRNDKNAEFMHIVDLKTKSSRDSEQIAYEAKALLELFISLLGDEKVKRGKTDAPSKNRLLLISRLMYYTKRTDRESFKEHDKDLRRMMRDHPNPGKNYVGTYLI